MAYNILYTTPKYFSTRKTIQALRMGGNLKQVLKDLGESKYCKKALQQWREKGRKTL